MIDPRYVLALLLLLVPGFVSGSGIAAAQVLFPNQTNAARSHPYDVVHIAIDVRFDIEKREVIGSVSHRIRSLSSSLRQIRLDAASNMKFNLVTVDGLGTSYHQRGDTLLVDLPTGAKGYGDSLTLRLDYRVVPTKGLYFIAPDSTEPDRRHQIWTQGEEEDNHYWVPIYDYPNDRSTSEVRIRLRSDWKALSNGRLRSLSRNEDGTSTWDWTMEKPHSSYLIVIAAGDYLVTRDTVGTIPLEYWSYPDMPDRVAPTFARTPSMIRFYEKLLGVPYPWNKYAQVMLDEFMYGGMENTTATTLNDYLLVDRQTLVDYDPDPTIAHEVAHQWFGDLVTNRKWGDLWLHESYATHLENVYMREKLGADWYAREIYLNGLEGIRSDMARGRDRLVDGKGHTENLYPRGARILHMLEQLLGSEIFWRAGRLFLERHAYGLVETNDLKIAFEDVSGLNLQWFFDQWIYGAGYPAFKVEQKFERGELELLVRQVQPRDSLTGLFRIPVPIEFHGESGIVRDTILVTGESETFRFPMRAAPRFVIFDAGDAILKTVDFPRSDAALVAQLDAPRFIDRYHAVQALSEPQPKGKSSPERIAALHRRFLREPSRYIREEIVIGAAVFDSPLVAEIVRKGLTDTAAAVRGQAIAQAFRITDKKERNALLMPLLRDSSRRNVASALGMLAASGSPDLLPYLKSLRGVRGRYNETLYSWLNAVASGGYAIFADDVAPWALPPNDHGLRIQALGTLAYLDTTTIATLSSIESGLRDTSAAIRLATGNVVRRRRNAQIDALLNRLGTELAGAPREYVVRLLKEEVLPGGSRP